MLKEPTQRCWELAPFLQEPGLSSCPPLVPALTYVQTSHRSNAPFTPRVLLCGPVGSGKSLQAALLAQKYGLINGECPGAAPLLEPSTASCSPGPSRVMGAVRDRHHFSLLLSAPNSFQLIHLCRDKVFCLLKNTAMKTLANKNMSAAQSAGLFWSSSFMSFGPVAFLCSAPEAPPASPLARHPPQSRSSCIMWTCCLFIFSSLIWFPQPRSACLQADNF